MTEAALIRARISSVFANVEFALVRAMRRRRQLRRPVERGPIMRLCGTPMADGDARTLVDLLLRQGDNDAVAAATVIEQGVRRHVFAVPLTSRQREAVLQVLGDAPDGLVKLRGILAQDQHERMG